MESTMLDPIDAALQAATPTVMVPRYSPFALLAEPGHRFLAADDGLWLELKRAWLYARMPVALQQTVAMPYGRLSEAIEIQCGPVPAQLVQDFADDAERNQDIEIAGAIIWNERTRAWRYNRLEATEASAAHISYVRPQMEMDEHLVIDMHSHGTLPAFFSPEDDRDDRGEVKIALVVGQSPATGLLETCCRLCVLGVHLTINLNDVLGLKEARNG